MYLLKILGLGVGGVAVLAAISTLDRSYNYTEIQGKVVKSEVECFVKSGKRSLVNKDTRQTAYMSCSIAPAMAEQFGYSKNDVKYRTNFSYKFVSPVDGSVQTHSKKRTGKKHKFVVGQPIKVYAHNETPSKSRLK